MSLNILYFGPITPIGKASRGGYAAANRKNCDCLRQKGCKVHEFPKINKFHLFFQPLQLLFRHIDKYTVIHISTPLGGLQMLPVLLIEMIAKIKNIPLVLDIRAGFFIKRFVQYNKFYKYLTKRMLNNADLVMVESRDYIKPLISIVGYKKEAYYFPNTVSPHQFYAPRYTDKLNIFYFGRITTEKGIYMMLDIINALPSNYHLYLAGSLANDIKEENLHVEKVSYLGLLDSCQLEELMKKMHFFLFPSYHIGEGQSNSLIEAMAQGLIPITSDNGFCREVVAECGKVLPMDATYKEYVNCIIEYDDNKINTYSKMCVDHICANHNIDTEIGKVIFEYRNLLS